MNNLPADISITILDFLTTKEALIFCNMLSKTVPPINLTRQKLYVPQIEGGVVERGGYDFSPSKKWHLVDIGNQQEEHGEEKTAISMIHSVELKFTWFDQGWGNRKGVISIVEQGKRAANDYEPPPEGVITSTLQELGTYAEHSEAEGQLCWKNRSNCFEIWLTPGGGGGHSLTVKNCSLTLFVIEMT